MSITTHDQQALHEVRGEDADIAYWEWNAEARGAEPSLIFAHATGFHGRVWDALIEHFASRHILSIDMRGHGRSGGEPIKHWQVLADDIARVGEHAGIAQKGKPPIGIGHSMGAHAMVQAAADNPGLFASLVLFDPVILQPEWYVSGALSFDESEPHPTIRRKRYFASSEAMFERFATRDPYQIFDPKVLRDYCDFGLVKVEGQEEPFELACPPEIEASVYMSSRSNAAIHDAARAVDVPVTIVRALQTNFADFKSSPTWTELANIFPKGRDIYRPDMTHFHPFQDPADAARIIREAEEASQG